jgi:hypothetical protein
MLLASMPRTDGRQVLVIGLMERNMELLRNDQPIRKALDGSDNGTLIPGLEGWIVYVLGPEDTARFIAEVRGASRDA